MTDLSASVEKIDPVTDIPVKEIKDEKIDSGLIIEEISGNTTEGGDTVFIPIRLKKKPIDTVIVQCVSHNEAEGDVKSNGISFTSS